MKKNLGKQPLPFCTVILLSGFISHSAFAQTYRWVDEYGVTHFSEDAPAEVANPESFKANRSTYGQDSSAKTEFINEHEEKREAYQSERKLLEEQVENTVSAERRDQFRRQLQQLDLNWYREHDPEKAAQIEQEMAAPEIRVTPLQQKPIENNMDRMKAFY